LGGVRPFPVFTMKMTGLSLLGLALAACASLVQGSLLSGSRSTSPVEKVVKLLEELKTRLEEDEKTEQQVYDKYACWCEKTTARKSEAIEGAKSDLRALGQDILSLKGKVATLAAEIAQGTTDIATNEEAQKEATAIRSKENAAYMAETAELKQAMEALSQALRILKSATSSMAMVQASDALSSALTAAGAKVEAAIAAAPGKSLGKFTRKSPDHPSRLMLVRELGHSKVHYAPQSATIQGILQEMYQTFATDLQAADSTEADANRAFEDLMATKQEELILLQAELKKDQKDKAESEQMLAESTQAYDDTEEQMKADIEFFDQTKAGCTAKANEWTERQTLRTQELAGIQEALKILTSDDARELFGKAFQPGIAPSFFQATEVAASSTLAPVVKKAFQALKEPAAKYHNLRLATIAGKVKLAKVGHFDEVISAIDKMVEDLKAEQTADIAKRDQCVEEYHKINSTTADLKWKIEVNEATIGKLSALIEKLNGEVLETSGQIEDVKAQIVEMKDQRKAENDAFLEAKKDDEDAIVLLNQAKDAISAYYAEHNIDLGKIQLVQQEPEFKKSQDQAPDADFSDKAHRKGESKGVLSILSMLAEDLANEIKVAQKAEEAAQLDFESALAAAATLQEKLEEKRTNLKVAITNRKADKGEEESKLETNEGDLSDEEKYEQEIKPDCDFMINNFDSRAEKRTAELNGLREAKEFLAGYEPDSDLALQQSAGKLSKVTLRTVARA